MAGKKPAPADDAGATPADPAAPAPDEDATPADPEAPAPDESPDPVALGVPIVDKVVGRTRFVRPRRMTFIGPAEG